MAEEGGSLNPFSGLLPESVSASTSAQPTSINAYDQKVNACIENVFLITMNPLPQKGRQLVFMEEIAQQNSSPLLTVDLLEQALFERILINTPVDYLIPNDRRTGDSQLAAESKCLTYLCATFERNEKMQNENDSILSDLHTQMRSLILRNAATAMQQPDLFPGQNLSTQLIEMFTNNFEDISLRSNFVAMCADTVMREDPVEGQKECLHRVFHPVLHDLLGRVRATSMITLEKWVFPLLMAFVCDKSVTVLADILLDFTTPPENAEGAVYADSLFGQLLRLSIMPKNNNGPFEYYSDPDSEMTKTLWSYLTAHVGDIHNLFKALLLHGGAVRTKMLTWLGNCLRANAPRGQIWSSHQMSMFGNMSTASDAFMINLCGVLLRLCQPLVKPQMKVLMVDASYVNVAEADRVRCGVHMRAMDKETCLVPVDEPIVRPIADKYNFVTECFFMAHKAIDLGYRVCIEKLIRMYNEIRRLEAAHVDAMAQGGSSVAQNVMDVIRKQMQQTLCLRHLIIEPTNDQMLMQFYEATAIWLTQITSNNRTSAEGFAPQSLVEVKLPLTNTVPIIMHSIPEFILENIVEYLIFVHNFESQAFVQNPDAASSLFTMILIFMGDASRARNPHLRARLAEGLESFLPKENARTPQANYQSSLLFSGHPYRLEIIPNLLQIFVGIEMTGQSVQFEQKFKYRRPMYMIMDYLWTIAEQREVFMNLAVEAEENMEAVDPPIFLRFINLLINDAIFLLDESLSNLQQIRTLQAAQDAGEWSTLPASEREQNLANLQHLGMMARFDNLLGRDTIKMLKLLTSEIKEIFCHASMVERVAAMLNYFLLHLVGPKKGNFKVKDKKEFEFDPAHMVLEICRIYINLEKCSTFCLAVSQDGRSYSSQLFEYAEEVLVRIGGGQLIGDINDFKLKIERLDQLQKKDQEALADAPDEFLDPIMSSLMVDPVILPSSHVTVDRTTIARHLLSDQSDPFNRSPLSMDQVKSDTELKARIEEWMRTKRDAYNLAKNVD